jgi:hypothetical protein
MELRQGYLAAPTDLYHTRRYARACQDARHNWPDYQWTEPALLRWTFSHWRVHWPEILSNLSLLAVVPRVDLTIGRGCWFEITDCQARAIPVVVWQNGHWPQLASLELSDIEDFRYWAKVKTS